MQKEEAYVTRLLQEKRIAPGCIVDRVEAFRKSGFTIATVNGSFDLLHAGHLQILLAASQRADRLVVALNSDSSVRRYKGIHRPFVSLEHRLQLIASLGCVNLVTWFDEDDPRLLLSAIRPDVHVNGSEYGENCLEAETVRQGGGYVYIVQRIPNLSTTVLIEKIRRS